MSGPSSHEPAGPPGSSRWAIPFAPVLASGCTGTAGEAGAGEHLAPRAYRRPLAAGGADELLALYSAARADATFAVGIATVIEALLQSPDFLYRIKWGTPDPARPELRQLAGDETATRLSYLLWGTMADERLRLLVELTQTDAFLYMAA